MHFLAHPLLAVFMCNFILIYFLVFSVECVAKCQNGGQCVNVSDCKCLSGWAGKTCEQRKDRYCAISCILVVKY